MKLAQEESKMILSSGTVPTAQSLSNANLEGSLMGNSSEQEIAQALEGAKEAINIVGAQYSTSLNMEYYEKFYKKYKEFPDFPEIAKANNSEDFFTDNLCSYYFQWIKINEADGKIVYVNRMTGQVSTTNPLADLTETIKRKQESEQNWAWIPNSKYVWLPSKFIKGDDKFLSYESSDKEALKIPKSDEGRIIPLDRFLLLHTTHDLTTIIEGRNEAYIMYLLASRYYKGKIYTNIGDKMLLSFNPYKTLPIYTEDCIELYKKSGDALPPHVFQLSRRVLDSLLYHKKSQSIMIIGESGSGKTEAYKECIKYIGNVCKGGKANIIELVMSTFLILEAIGNAKNSKNNNSSRYGKWMEILIDDQGKISGCTIQNYLLEKSRVSCVNKGERNFHIFYYMLKGIKGKQRESLFLEDIDDYNYLNSTGCSSVDSVDDREMFGTLSKSLFSIFQEERDSLLEIWSACLLFGNIQFEEVKEPESSKVKNPELLIKIGTLLKIEPKYLENALTKLIFPEYTRLFTKEKAIDAANACAKTLYSKLFDYVVKRINDKFKEFQSVKTDEKVIGMLDIYGFEIMEINSFEQLCINYANEKLHEQFVHTTYKLEKDLYKDQGITVVESLYKDNEQIIMLIEHNLDGIFSLIEDEIHLPKGSDEKLLSKMNSKYSAKKDLYGKVIKIPQCFKILHYTSPVTYRVTNFLDKAKDEVSWNILGMFGDSSHGILKQLFKPSKSITPEEVKESKQNIGIQYKNEIGRLIKTIQKGEPHYIKCILPNRERLPMFYEPNVVHEQLLANGIMEALETYHKGYSVKMSIGEFIQKFKPLVPIEIRKKSSLEIKDLLANIHNVDVNTIKIGKTMVFLKNYDMKMLESQLNKIVEKSMQKIMKYLLSFRAKLLKKRLKGIKVVLIKALETNTIAAYDEALKAASSLKFTIFEYKKCKENREKLYLDAKIAEQLNKMVPSVVEEKKAISPPKVESTTLVPENLESSAKEVSKTESNQEQKKEVDSASGNRDELISEAISRPTGEAEKLEETNSSNANENTSAAKEITEKGKEIKQPTPEEFALEKLLEQALVIYTSEEILNGALTRAKAINLSNSTLIEKCEKLLEKKLVERNHIESSKQILAEGALKTPFDILEGIKSIIPQEKALSNLQALAPYDSKEIQRIIQDGETLLKLRKLYIQRNNDALEKELTDNPKITYLNDTGEIDVMHKYIDNVHEGRELHKKLKLALEKKNITKIKDLLAEGKLLRLQWDEEIFKQAMAILTKLSELGYYKEKAKKTKSITLIQMALQKLEEYDPADPAIAELKALKIIVKDLIEECVVALNVLERPQMEEILAKAKTLQVYNELTDTMDILLNEMDPDVFEEMQFKVALRLGDNKLLLKRMIEKKKREIINNPNGAEIFKLDKCPILQPPSAWARKSLLGDMFGLEDRHKSFLKWTLSLIHKPLTSLADKRLIKESLDVFKNIMFFMGDKEHKAPMTCAQAVILSGIHNDILRDEIYIQIMKQMTDNPNMASIEKGWELIAYCLKAFSPIVTQSYLEYFIRTKCKFPEQMLILMYTKILFEPTNLLQINEVRALLANPIKLDSVPLVSGYVPCFSPRTDPQLLSFQPYVLKQLQQARQNLALGISKRKS